MEKKEKEKRINKKQEHMGTENRNTWELKTGTHGSCKQEHMGAVNRKIKRQEIEKQNNLETVITGEQVNRRTGEQNNRRTRKQANRRTGEQQN